MSRLLQPLLLLLGRSDEHDLRRQVQYLKAENEILRDRLPGRIVTTPKERARLLKFGRPLGAAIGKLISIVTVGTFRRWGRDTDSTDGKRRRCARAVGLGSTPRSGR